MLSVKKLTKVVLTTMLCTGMSIAGAATLTIQNNTNEYSTTKSNGKMCSNVIKGGKGITAPHSQNIVQNFTLRTACFPTLDNCVADVYMTTDCSGENIATVTFDVNGAGVKGEIKNHSDKYIVKGSGFYVEVSYK